MRNHESADTAAAAIEPRAETPNQVHGRLLEGVHLAGYTFERACTHLEWLLDEDRWREVGAGYTDINVFLAGTRLDEFRIVAEQRKRIARRIRELQPDASNRAIAKTLGVSDMTVHRDTSTNVEGPPLKAQEVEGAAADTSTNVEPTTGPVRGTQDTGNNEWYTPPEYLERARAVLGEFDLDPASSDAAQRVVQAAQYFTKEDDGLAHEWHGRVWLNSPYSQPLIAYFVTKLIAEYRAGRVTAAIMLTHNYTGTAWFHEAAADLMTKGSFVYSD